MEQGDSRAPGKKRLRVLVIGAGPSGMAVLCQAARLRSVKSNFQLILQISHLICNLQKGDSSFIVGAKQYWKWKDAKQ